MSMLSKRCDLARFRDTLANQAAVRWLMNSFGIQITFLALIIASFCSFAEEVNSSNADVHGYKVIIEVPDKTDPEFKRIKIILPEKLSFFEYSYTSVLYSQEGKKVISYRPQAYASMAANDHKEFYILASEDAFSCLSIVNIYFDKRDKSLHPPSRSIHLDLSSFLPESKQVCKGKLDAADYY